MMPKLSTLFIIYQKLIERTSKIAINGVESLHKKHFLLGFWHEDSFTMMLLLKIMARRGITATAIVTADKRGDAIEDIVRASNGKTFRLHYSGNPLNTVFKNLIRQVTDSEENIATALDGPLGPRHKPKKFLLLLANKTGKTFIGANIHYARKIRLTRRWDNYVIPLPFNKITINILEFGPVSTAHLHSFLEYGAQIAQAMLSGALPQHSAEYRR